MEFEVVMADHEGKNLRRVVVCPPGPAYAREKSLTAHNFRGLPDLEKCRRQHQALCGVMRDAGAEVVEVSEQDGHPNSLFTRDTSLVTPVGYVQLRMGLESRRGEERWIAAHLERLGVPRAGVIEPPGTVEGGDVVLAGRVAFLGRSSRSNAAGGEQLSILLGKMGYEIRVREIGDDFLHIGGSMSVVGPETVLACAGVFPQRFFHGFDLIEVDDRSFAAVNVICLGTSGVILHREFRATIGALDAKGFTVHALDFSEILKGCGGPTCTILPVERGE
ncbi:MAG: dimethylarginine dimethylaminohydrolase family protein [Acidobacteriota bacterium]